MPATYVKLDWLEEYIFRSICDEGGNLPVDLLCAMAMKKQGINEQDFAEAVQVLLEMGAAEVHIFGSMMHISTFGGMEKEIPVYSEVVAC